VWPIEEGRDSAQVREAARADRARVTITFPFVYVVKACGTARAFS
jgi:hypothetical protein